jgi:hypothetical protein
LRAQGYGAQGDGLNSKHEDFLKRYAFNLGSLVSNFQGLELLLRAFLLDQVGAAPIGLPHGQDFYSAPVGSTVPVCPLTNYDSLGKLIEKFNEIADAQGKAKLDPTLVDIRDALAHGRIAALSEGKPMRLVKYSRPLEPKKTTVRVTFYAELNDKWFSDQRGRVISAIETVLGAAIISGPQIHTSLKV